MDIDEDNLKKDNQDGLRITNGRMRTDSMSEISDSTLSDSCIISPQSHVEIQNKLMGSLTLSKLDET